MSARTEEYTFGVEEEYQIIDPETRELIAQGGRVVQRAQQALGEEVAPEVLASQIEVMTRVCRTLAEVRDELLRLRREVIEAAAKEGYRIAAASTHPFSRWQEQQVTPKTRYRNIMEYYQRVFRQQLAFGLHVHVGLSDREAAVQVMNRARVWLAPMLALSANSPFWLGTDTGYASYRAQVWGMLPTAGQPAPFESLAEYEALLEALVATGTVEEPTKIYWDIRLSERVETVEVRIMDVCSMVDVEAGHAVPAREMIEKLLGFVRPALEEGGDWEEVSGLVSETLERGNGARRQRQAYERAGRLEDVVDMLIEETAEGTT